LALPFGAGSDELAMRSRDITVNTLGWNNKVRGDAVGTWQKMESSLSVYRQNNLERQHVLALELLRISSSYRITTVIMVLFEGK
jgi:hypothetical protein